MGRGEETGFSVEQRNCGEEVKEERAACQKSELDIEALIQGAA
jgi:hypothetical protein